MSFRLLTAVRVLFAMRALDLDARRQVGARLDALLEQPRPEGVVRLRAEGLYRVTVDGIRVLYVIDDAAGVITVVDVRMR